MEHIQRVFSLVIITFVLFASKGEGGTFVRDFSGDAMQRNNSRMMNSPLHRVPPLLGLSPWPFIPYLPAPSLTLVHVEIHLPASVPPAPIPPPNPPARPKFWTNRCGIFVEIELSPETNFMEEERHPCSH